MSTKPGTRRAPSTQLSTLPVSVVAAVVGAACGLLAVVLIWSGERGCDAVRGTPSCGGYGFGLLLLVVAVMAAGGYFALQALHVANAGFVTFFGVALPLIMVMALLMDEVFSPWMTLVVPLLAAGGFAGAAVVVPALEGAREPTYADATADQPVALPRYAPEPPSEPETMTETTEDTAAERLGGLRADDGAPLLGDIVTHDDPDDEHPAEGQRDDHGHPDEEGHRDVAP